MKASNTRYRHLTEADLDYVTISANVEDVVIGDLIFDGQMWVRGMGSDATLGVPAVRLDLEAWTGDAGVTGSLGRLALATGTPVKIARIVTPPTSDASTARLDPAATSTPRIVPTASLRPADRVLFYGEEVEVKTAHKNGLIVFVGGDVHQSRPDLFWGVVDATPSPNPPGPAPK